MKAIGYIWKSISNIGVQDELQRFDYLRIRLINQVLVVTLVVLLVAIGLYQYFAITDMLNISLLAFGIMTIGVLLSYFRQHKFLQHYFIVATGLIVLMGTFIVERWIHFYIFLFPLTVVVHFLYHKQRYYVYYGIFFISILLLLFITIQPVHYSSTMEQYVSYGLIMLCMIAQLGILNFFSYENHLREKELLKGQHLIEYAQNIAKLGSWEYYMEKEMMVWSDKMFDLLGFPSGYQPTFKRDILGIIPNYQPLIRRIIQSNKLGQSFNFRFPHQVGLRKKWFQIRGEVRFSETHKCFKLSGTLQDITENVEIEHQLAKSYSTLETTLEATLDGILVVNMVGKVISHNPKFLEIWQIPMELIDEGSDQKLVEFVKSQAADPRQFTSKIQELYKNPEYISFDELKLKDGRILERYSQPQKLFGNIIGRVWSFRDVTEQRENAQQIQNLLQEVNEQKSELELKTLQLEQSNGELKRSNQELEQFAYAASHDLQEPLRMVGNFVELLEEEYEDTLDEEGKLYIQYTVDGVKRMSKLIENLLEYSRVGRKEIAINNVNVKSIIDNKIMDLSQRIKDKNAVVLVEDNLPKFITCEQEQLGIVFYNLIGNALKFNKNEKPKVLLGGEEKEDHWQFYVMDNGIGIDPKYQKRIFEIFKRLHRKEEFEGTGIGLSLCKRIILRHRGDIWFESELGKGTTFYFTISKFIQHD